jgi:pyridoxal/pyridoxine/pyridoxamine kinase
MAIQVGHINESVQKKKKKKKKNLIIYTTIIGSDGGLYLGKSLVSSAMIR